jgi:hypothetical protein
MAQVDCSDDDDLNYVCPSSIEDSDDESTVYSFEENQLQKTGVVLIN